MFTKKHFIAGFVLPTIIAASAFAAPGENVKDYSLRVKEAAEQYSKMAKDARGNRDQILASKAFKDLQSNFGLDETESIRVAQAIADGKTYIVSAMYASVAARELLGRGSLDEPGADVGIASVLQVASLAGKGNAMDPNLALTPQEMADAGQALRKKTEYSIDMLTWGKADSETHIAVMKKALEIQSSRKVTSEEALVMAIMEVKGIDKDAAMKIIRKLRDCV